MISAPASPVARRALRGLTLVLLGLASALAGVGAADHSAPLTTAAQVRALTEEQARRALPVRLHGVFIGEADPEGIAFVIHDETEGIYVQGPPELVTGLRRGDRLEIDGITDPGGFAPYVVARSIVKTGQSPLPAPLRVSLDQLSSGQMDARWIEVSGIVRSVDPKTPSDSARPPPGTRYAVPSGAPFSGDKDPKVKMKLASGSARLTVQVSGDFDPDDYVDAEVRLRGLCFNLHNRNRQFVRPFVQVPRGVELIIERPPPGKPFAGDPRPVASLLHFDQLTGQQGHRVHVRGIVVHHQPGSALWIRDRESSLRIETTQTEPLQPGDEVDVMGFPTLRGYSAELVDGIFRKRSEQPAPAPHVLTDVSSALHRDADLVQLEARLTELRRLTDSVALVLDWGATPVRAQLRLPENAQPPAGWLPGSLVRASGVCAVLTDEAGPLGGLWEPRSFQLLLRSPADLAIVEPPSWWNAERVVWVLAAFLVLALAAVAAVVTASRRRLHEQEHRRAMAEAEFTAILSERNRVAREIHDTLSQNLGAISVQLELARTHAGEISPAARNHLGVAHKLARAALTDARDSIWNMRSQVLERGDLGQALEGILTQATEGTAIAPQMEVEGLSRRLPPVVENNLLRIGQEAITNAGKHARPTRIEVRLAFDGRTVRLTVADDGIGFVPGTPPKGSRSFGLMGIKERAQLLGGDVDIQSAPGQGTRVVVTVTV